MSKPQLLHLSVLTLVLLLVGAIAFLYLQIIELRATLEQNSASAELREKSLQVKINQQESELLEAQSLYTRALNELELTQEEKENLRETLEEAEEQVEEIEEDYNRINDAVSDLLKLKNTDEELLQKYSKVYFLNENYIPSRLSDIDSQYLLGSKQLQVHSDVKPFLDDMLEEAEEDDIELLILSAYRSFTYQQQIKQNYLTIYGSGANQFSADQGFSEHQLGTAVDFTIPENGSSLSLFKNTEAYQWLQDNAYKYGFVLSYPEGNEFYQYEPWHWRFVGKDLARYLDRKDLHFYDLDQREIDTYLLEIFD